ncbi:hypothetical protein [Streptomyces canus]|uniref:hypothetical protein n=1 Tax=Streptomyces canus TaxID=58343 RepID=UPI0034406F8C
MRSRTVLLILFLIPLLWGMVSLLRAGSAEGVPDCPGLHLGADGEEHSGAMKRGDRCELSYDNASGHSVGTSTYQQLEFAQELKRKSLSKQGTWLLAYAVVGMGAAVIITRKRSVAT